MRLLISWPALDFELLGKEGRQPCVFIVCSRGNIFLRVGRNENQVNDQDISRW